MNERRGMRSRGAKEFSNVLFNCILLPPTPRPCLEPFYISMLKCTIAPLLTHKSGINMATAIAPMQRRGKATKDR
jgi:hypothetical protein